ncbi:MAG: AbrB/MazE/SpoVT family DNA-binding domain-containing protein [Candidatus Altiarchaeota archaeon]
MDCVTLSSKGQIVLMKGVRDKLGLKAGDKLVETVQENSIVLRPVKSTKELFGVLKNSNGFRGKSTEDIVAEIDSGWK